MHYAEQAVSQVVAQQNKNIGYFWFFSYKGKERPAPWADKTAGTEIFVKPHKQKSKFL